MVYLLRLVGGILVSWTLLFNAMTESKAASIKCIGSYPSESPIHSVDPTNKAAKCSNLLIQGPIERGDYERLSNAIQQHYPYVSLVSLQSSGGSLGEAVKIGRLVRKYMLYTTAPAWLEKDQIGFLIGQQQGSSLVCVGPECACSSACFFIWVAGLYRGGDSIFVHRPFFDRATLAEMGVSESQGAYAALTEQLKAYIRAMSFDEEIVGIMMRIPPDETIRLGVANASDPFPEFFEEWIFAKCGRRYKPRDGAACVQTSIVRERLRMGTAAFK